MQVVIFSGETKTVLPIQHKPSLTTEQKKEVLNDFFKSIGA